MGQTSFTLSPGETRRLLNAFAPNQCIQTYIGSNTANYESAISSPSVSLPRPSRASPLVTPGGTYVSDSNYGAFNIASRWQIVLKEKFGARKIFLYLDLRAKDHVVLRPLAYLDGDTYYSLDDVAPSKVGARRYGDGSIEFYSSFAAPRAGHANGIGLQSGRFELRFEDGAYTGSYISKQELDQWCSPRSCDEWIDFEVEAVTTATLRLEKDGGDELCLSIMADHPTTAARDLWTCWSSCPPWRRGDAIVLIGLRESRPGLKCSADAMAYNVDRDPRFKAVGRWPIGSWPKECRGSGEDDFGDDFGDATELEEDLRRSTQR